MKKLLILFPLFCFSASLGFAQIAFTMYPGGYLGGNWPAADGMSFGGDFQMGFEIGRFYYNEFIFGFQGNIGIDSGLPNKPNFYYGGLMEIYWGLDIVKIGLSMGIGGNRGFKTGENQKESVYLRFGIPLNANGIFKIGPVLDIYPKIGSRLGILMNFGIHI